MAEKSEDSLQKRVERLEAVVADIQKVLQQTHESLRQKGRKETGSPSEDFSREQTGVALPSPAEPIPGSSGASRKSFEFPENMRTSEYWLNKIGIGLLLFGVVFLFKYSVDQGWLPPSVRVGFGVSLGLGLVLAGLRIAANRRHFGQVLMGGGIAALYITGFAAFQVFTLISHPVAFIFMVSVTLLALILSLRQNGVVLALIGAIGGLGTPFLLYTGTGNLPGLIGYTCLVLGGTTAVYFYRGWHSLLWISVIGGWLVFLIGLNQGFPTDTPGDAVSERWTVQSGIVFSWLIFWALPLIREFVWAKNPARRQRRSLESGEKPTSQVSKVVPHRHLHLLSVFTPLIALWMSMHIWSLSNPTWGWITLGGALVYGIVAKRLSGLNVIKDLSHTHALIGVMLLTYAVYLLLDGDTLLFVLATEAAVLQFIARRLSDKKVAITAHLLFGALGLWLIQRLSCGQVLGNAIFNMPAMTNLWVITVASVVSVRAIYSNEKKIYLFLAHLALLGWFLRELTSLSNGQGYVTIAWGVYALILLILGLRMNFDRIRTVAMGTLLLVVGKLFLVDLAELETIWRVLLFMGFGGLFLLLSYYFQSLWKSNGKPSNS